MGVFAIIPRCPHTDTNYKIIIRDKTALEYVYICAKSKRINSFAKLLRLDMDANQTADIHRSIISLNNTNFLVSCESTFKIYNYFCKQTTKPKAGRTESATVYYSANESEITLIFLRPLMFRDTISSHIF